MGLVLVLVLYYGLYYEINKRPFRISIIVDDINNRTKFTGYSKWLAIYTENPAKKSSNCTKLSGIDSNIK